MSEFILDPKKSSLNDPEEDSEDVLESLGDEKDDAFSSMSDDLGAEEPLEEPEPYVAPPNKVADRDYVKIEKSLEFIGEFSNLDEITGKKASKDGLMTKVTNCATRFYKFQREMIDSRWDERYFGEPGAKLVGEKIDEMIKACDDYIAKKHPWFAKGQARKAKVEELKENAKVIQEYPQGTVSFFRIAGSVEDFNNNNEITTHETDRLINGGAKHAGYLKDFTNNRMSLRTDDFKDRGAMTIGYSLTQTGDAKDADDARRIAGGALGGVTFGTNLRSQREEGKPLEDEFLKSQKPSGAEEMEKLFDILLNEDLSKYKFYTLGDMMDDDFKHKHQIVTIATEMQRYPTAYAEFIMAGFPGLKFNTPQKLAKVYARVDLFMMMSNIYTALARLAGNEDMKLMRGRSMDLMKLKFEEVQDLAFYWADLSFGEDSKKQKMAPIIKSLADVLQGMDRGGFRPGDDVSKWESKYYYECKEKLKGLGLDFSKAKKK